MRKHWVEDNRSREDSLREGESFVSSWARAAGEEVSSEFGLSLEQQAVNEIAVSIGQAISSSTEVILPYDILTCSVLSVGTEHEGRSPKHGYDASVSEQPGHKQKNREGEMPAHQATPTVVVALQTFSSRRLRSASRQSSLCLLDPPIPASRSVETQLVERASKRSAVRCGPSMCMDSSRPGQTWLSAGFRESENRRRSCGRTLPSISSMSSLLKPSVQARSENRVFGA
ncbi:hypothetical protein AXG93_1162s1170 [Marchantia polymorpha subsp. ruderalis]|uniref:Uncharacterized protein n=1 Tax=Marchantia polymorpha subsp. ruderalis TaxID=1480154 RepID=A0A176WRK5_MARPO|nr:hypothetical protein AXG93_1162s1170 [Marchantia polymorpha subsp. ruderalis]